MKYMLVLLSLLGASGSLLLSHTLSAMDQGSLKKQQNLQGWQEFFKNYPLSSLFVWNTQKQPSVQEYRQNLQAVQNVLYEKKQVFKALACIKDYALCAKKCQDANNTLGIQVSTQNLTLFICASHDPDEQTLCNYLTYGTSKPDKIPQKILRTLPLPGTPQFCLIGDEWQKLYTLTKTGASERIKRLAQLVLDYNSLSDLTRRRNPSLTKQTTVEDMGKKLERLPFSREGKEKYMGDMTIALNYADKHILPDIIPDQQPLLNEIKRELENLR